MYGLFNFLTCFSIWQFIKCIKLDSICVKTCIVCVTNSSSSVKEKKNNSLILKILGCFYTIHTQHMFISYHLDGTLNYTSSFKAYTRSVNPLFIYLLYINIQGLTNLHVCFSVGTF